MLEAPNDGDSGGIAGGQNYSQSYDGGAISGGNWTDYGGSGGAIGGYNLPGTSNYSGYTGVGSGSGYNSFTPALPNVAAPGVGVINNANFILTELRAGLISKDQVANVVAWIHAQLISLFGTKDKSLKQYQATAIDLGQQIQNAADSVLSQQSVVTPTPTTPTETPTQTQSILDQLKSLLSGGTPSADTFEAPANLYSVTPNSNQGSTSNMPKILILVAVIAAGYFLYKKYA